MIIMSAQTELYVWDVGDGAAIYVKTPNGKNVVIDCGASDDFSPTEYLKNSLGVTQIDYLIISHPHKDHIKDFENIEDHYGYKENGELRYHITTLNRNKGITREIMIESNEDLEDDEDVQSRVDHD